MVSESMITAATAVDHGTYMQKGRQWLRLEAIDHVCVDGCECIDLSLLDSPLVQKSIHFDCDLRPISILYGCIKRAKARIHVSSKKLYGSSGGGELTLDLTYDRRQGMER